MHDFESAQGFLHNIHDFVTSGESEETSSAPLSTLIVSFSGAVLEPDATAPAHAGLRNALAALLYSSHSPPDLVTWLESTDLIGSKDVSAGRRQV
jgi:hypothetical protein